MEYPEDKIPLVACRAPSVLTRIELATEFSLDAMKLASQQAWYMPLSRSMASTTTLRSQVLRLLVELRKITFAGGSMAPCILPWSRSIFVWVYRILFAPGREVWRALLPLHQLVRQCELHCSKTPISYLFSTVMVSRMLIYLEIFQIHCGIFKVA